MSQALHLASYQSFQCHSCGRCCRNSWAIVVEPAARQAIAQSKVAAAAEREGYLPLVLLPDSSVVTGRRENGACVFLSPERLCSVHGELGGPRKPLACQLYPYSLTATPDGYFASLSFACPAVVEGHGGDLQANERELRNLLTERGSSAEVPDGIEVVEGRQVSWKSYLQLEQRLLEAFDPVNPTTSLLGATVAILHALQLSPEGDPPWPALRHELDQDAFEESVLAMISASVIALWELPDDPDGRQLYSQGVLMGEQKRSRRHGFDLPPFDLARPQSDLLRHTFERYFRNAVFGKSLLTSSIVSRLLLMACGFVLVMYYGEAFRAAAGAREIGLEALSRAFELVEADLVTHTRSVNPLFITFEATLRQAHILEP